MKRLLTLTALALLASGLHSIQAQKLFDMSAPDHLIDFGARIGINTSNQTSPSGGKISNLDSWGAGFEVGGVANLNIFNAIAVQPGVFIETRSHRYSYVMEPVELLHFTMAEYGHDYSTWLKIPLLASVRLNPDKNIQVATEAGPVFGFGIGGRDKTHFYVPGLGSTKESENYFNDHKNWSFGWKLGGTVRYAGHYMLGVHYEAGTSSVYRFPLKGGHHKAWIFTLGYDF